MDKDTMGVAGTASQQMSGDFCLIPLLANINIIWSSEAMFEWLWALCQHVEPFALARARE